MSASIVIVLALVSVRGWFILFLSSCGNKKRVSDNITQLFRTLELEIHEEEVVVTGENQLLGNSKRYRICRRRVIVLALVLVGHRPCAAS